MRILVVTNGPDVCVCQAPPPHDTPFIRLVYVRDLNEAKIKIQVGEFDSLILCGEFEPALENFLRSRIKQ